MQRRTGVEHRRGSPPGPPGGCGRAPACRRRTGSRGSGGRRRPRPSCPGPAPARRAASARRCGRRTRARLTAEDGFRPLRRVGRGGTGPRGRAALRRRCERRRYGHGALPSGRVTAGGFPSVSTPVAAAGNGLGRRDLPGTATIRHPRPARRNRPVAGGRPPPHRHHGGHPGAPDASSGTQQGGYHPMPRTRRSPAAAFAVTAVLAMTAAACGPGHPAADAKPTPAATSLPASPPPSAGPHLKLPSGLPTSCEGPGGVGGAGRTGTSPVAARGGRLRQPGDRGPVEARPDEPARPGGRQAGTRRRQRPDQGVTDPRARPGRATRGQDALPLQRGAASASCSSTVRRARWSARRRWSRTRRTRASPTWCGPPATACTRARRAAGTATSPSCPRTTTARCRAAALRSAPGARCSRRTGCGGRDWAQTSHQWISHRRGERRQRFAVRLRGAARDARRTAAASRWRRRSAPRCRCGSTRPSTRRDRVAGRVGLSGGAAVRRRSGCSTARAGRAGCRSTPSAPTEYRHRLHDDRRLVGRRLVRQAAGRQDGAGLQHLDRPGDGDLAGRSAPGRGGQGRLRRGEPEVRRRSSRDAARRKGPPPVEGAGPRCIRCAARFSASARPGCTAPARRPVPRAPAP